MNELKTTIKDFFARTKMSRMKASGAKALELKDIEDNSVIFECADEDEIAEGTPATPNGTFTFANGKVITIEDGKVVKVEIAEQPAEETEQPEQVEAEGEEQPADEKDAKIAELEAKVAELEDENTDLKKQLEDAQSQLEANAKELAHINDFAKSLGFEENKEYKAQAVEVEDMPKRFSFKHK